jgi:hypothetical protein
MFLGCCQEKVTYKKVISLVSPQHFISAAYERVVPHPFHEHRLWNKDLSERLCLEPDDNDSVLKFRVCAVTLALTISLRAIQEAFIHRFEDDFPSLDSVGSFLGASQMQFDAVAAKELSKAVGMPSYADASYFVRWRKRLNEQIVEKDAPPLRPAAITGLWRQATFAYGIEPKVRATDVAIVAQGEEVFDNYSNALKREFAV